MTMQAGLRYHHTGIPTNQERADERSDGVTVAFIVDNGVPIEFLQFDRPESGV